MKETEKQIIKKLMYNDGIFRITLSKIIMNNMGWENKDQILIINNTNKKRIEMYNLKQIEKDGLPRDFPIRELKRRMNLDKYLLVFRRLSKT